MSDKVRQDVSAAFRDENDSPPYPAKVNMVMVKRLARYLIMQLSDSHITDIKPFLVATKKDDDKIVALQREVQLLKERLLREMSGRGQEDDDDDFGADSISSPPQ